MKEAFLSGGIVMWPLLLIGVAVLVIAARAALQIRGAGASEGASTRLRALLFWGVMSLVLGLLGTTIGIVQMTQAIALAGGAEVSTISAGIGVSLVTFIFGILVFLVAASLWFALRQWQLRTQPRPALEA